MITFLDNYSILLGQYTFFLTHLHGRSFFLTGVFFSKMCLIRFDDASDSFSTSDRFYFSNASDTSIGIPNGIPGITVLLSWLCPRYQYLFPVGGIILCSAMLMRHFYFLIRPGNNNNLIALLIILDTIFSENLTIHEIKQWQSTMIIMCLIVTVLRLLYWLAQASITDGNNTFPLMISMLTLSFAFILSAYCKEYVNNYVPLSKI